MFNKKIQKIIYLPILKYKSKRIGNEIISGITAGHKNILDFGCGDMVMTKYITGNLPDVEITPIDVIDTNLTDMVPQIYDGNRIPFPDKTFDLTYTCFVLHHCNSPEQALSEIIRVTKKRIIIIEEIYNNVFEEKVTYINDWIMNRLESAIINIPFNFKNDREWRDLFSKLGLRLVESRRVHTLPLYPTKQIMYILEPNA